jgi:hypothetical protein
MKHRFLRSAPPLILALIFCAATRAPAAEPITITVSSIKDLNLRIYGFVETDYISDTTQGFTEEMDNNLVPTAQTITGAANYAGQHDHGMMSIRNSRLGFEFNLPKTEAGLRTQGVIELDLLGNNAPNTTPGATPGSQSESNFFNNPAVRVRHAYVDLTYDAWDAKIGQTWSLLGWQPYYFPGETAVLPSPGMLYRRFAQARAMNTLAFLDHYTLESAADAAKPGEMDSGLPEFHAGLRVASTKTKGASINGAGTSMVGLSAAASGALIPVRTSLGDSNGGAVAIDAFVPIIPSRDGQDRRNNLVWAGEALSGSGVGGLEYSALSLGVPGVQAAAAANGTPGAGTAVDPGIAGINNGGTLSLIRFRAFRTHLQYSLPCGKWAVSAGYAQVEGRNIGDFGVYAAKASALLATKIQYGYASLFFDPLSWLRFAAEFSQTRDTYTSGFDRFAYNNRAQLSAFFVF